MTNDIELINPNIPHGKVRCAVFDFDGTLSLLREGWPQVMRALMWINFMLDVVRQMNPQAPLYPMVLPYDPNGQKNVYVIASYSQPTNINAPSRH